MQKPGIAAKHLKHSIYFQVPRQLFKTGTGVALLHQTGAVETWWDITSLGGQTNVVDDFSGVVGSLAARSRRWHRRQLDSHLARRGAGGVGYQPLVRAENGLRPAS